MAASRKKAPPVALLAEKIELVPIDSIEPHPDNPNEGDVGEIASSIEAIGGFYQVIFVQRSTGRILAGEHRWRTLSAAGAPEAPVVFLDVDDATALRILIGDNEIPRRHSRPNEARLSELLLDLQQSSPIKLAGTGFDHEDLDRLLADLSTDLRARPDAVPAKERLTQFASSEVRQIVLITDVATFDRTVRVLARMRGEHGQYETNTDAILALIDAWDAAHPA